MPLRFNRAVFPQMGAHRAKYWSGLPTVFALCLLCWLAPAPAAQKRIAWIGSEPVELARSSAFRQRLLAQHAGALELVDEELGAVRLDLEGRTSSVEPAELAARLNRFNLVISTDARAAEAIERADFRGAHLALYRPNMARSDRARYSSIAVNAHRNQWQALLGELHRQLPAINTVGMVFNADERHHAGLWYDWLAQHQLTLQPLLLRYGESAPPFLAIWLHKVDLWWLPPGHTALQAHEWPSAMLTALQKQRPVLAYAPEQLAAGAWLALFCAEPERDAQGLLMVQALLSGGRGEHQNPARLTLVQNQAVAKRLALNLDLAAMARRLPFAVLTPQAQQALSPPSAQGRSKL